MISQCADPAVVSDSAATEGTLRSIASAQYLISRHPNHVQRNVHGDKPGFNVREFQVQLHVSSRAVSVRRRSNDLLNRSNENSGNDVSVYE